MLSLLSRIFIPDRDKVSDPAVRRAWGKLCGIYGIVLNLLLFAAKLAAALLTGSVAIRADALNNLTDAGSSVITLLGFAIAGKKPDPDHPFGHGRFEYLAGLALSAVIILTGVELAKSSIEKILRPEEMNVSLLSALILLLAIGVKLYMYAYNRATARRIHSEAMEATAADSLTDTAATALVLLAMGVRAVFHVNIDGWAGLLVAAFIIYSGAGAMKDTVSPLLGKAPDKDFVAEIERIVLSHPEIRDIHDLIVHDYGPGRIIISLHAEVDGRGDIFALHDAIDRAENELKDQLGCLATIHMDPIESDDTELSHLRHETAEKLKEIDSGIRIHDFRTVPGTTHTNLIFDALIPAACPKSDEELKSEIKTLIHATWPDRNAVVHIDRDYT